MHEQLRRRIGRGDFQCSHLAGLWVAGLAIVCAHHWLPPTLTHGVLRGAYGAELLFGLVGFSTTWFAVQARDALVSAGCSPGQALRAIYARLASRTLPIYFAFLVAIFFASEATNETHLALWTFSYHFLAAMKGELTGTLAHMWAPSIAFWFCVLWIPSVVYLSRPALLPAVAGLIGLGIATRMVLAASGSPPVVLRCAGVTSLDALGSGALASLLILRHGVPRVAGSRWSLGLLAAGVPWIVWGMVLQYDRHGGERALWETFVITTKVPLLFTVLVLGAREGPGLFGGIFSGAFVRLLASATSGIYLAHAFTPPVLRKMMALPVLPFGVLALGAMTCGIGVVLHVFFERRIARRFFPGGVLEPGSVASEDARRAA